MSDETPIQASVSAPTVVAAAHRPPGMVRRLMRGLSPVRLAANLRNPILQKEIFVAGRRRSTYVTRCVVLLILLAIVCLSYLPTMVELGEGATGLMFMQRVQELAPRMTVVIVWFEFATLLLIGPMLVGGSLCDERRSGTLGALMTTPLTAFQIVSGKLLASLSQMVILVLLALPIILSLRVFGGVSLDTVLGMASVVITSAILASTLSMFYSAKAPRGFNAAVSGILSTCVVHGGVSLFFVWMGAKQLVAPNVAYGTASTLCAPAVLGFGTAELLGESSSGMLGVRIFDLCMYNSLYSLAITALAFVAVVFRLRKVMLMDAGSAVTFLTRKQKRRAKASAAAAVSPVASYTAAPGTPIVAASTQDSPIVEQDSREVGDRPVLWRELAQPAFRSRARFVISLILVAGVLLYLNSQIDDERSRHSANMVVVGIGTGLAVLISAGAAAHVFTQERESRTLDVLLTTPLTAKEIVRGKFWGALRRQWFIPTVLLVHLLLSGVFASTVPMVAMLHLAAVLFVFLAFLTSVGVWMSVISKKTTGAGVRTSLIALGMWLLPFPVIGVLSGLLNMLGSQRLVEEMVGLVSVVNPVYLAVMSLTVPSFWGSSTPGYRLQDPFGNLDFGEFTALLAVVLGMFMVLTKLVLWRARVVLGSQSNRRH